MFVIQVAVAVGALLLGVDAFTTTRLALYDNGEDDAFDKLICEEVPGQTSSPSHQPTPKPSRSTSPSTPDSVIFSRLSLISDPALFDAENSDTDQYSAYQWVSNNVQNPASYDTLEQLYILVLFYYSTNGNSWVSSTDWLTTSNKCCWYGVECDAGSNVESLSLGKLNLIPSL